MFFESNNRALKPGTTLRQRIASYQDNSDRWYTGKIAACDTRLEVNARLLHEARQLAAQKVAWIPIVAELEADREAVSEARNDLITAAQDREAEYTPGESYSDHKFDSGDGGKCRWCKNDAKHQHHRNTAALAPADERWVELEARKFVRDNADADIRELQIRARNHAEYNTGTLSQRRSAAVTERFVHTCSDLYTNRPKQRVAAAPRPNLDFDASLIYL